MAPARRAASAVCRVIPALLPEYVDISTFEVLTQTERLVGIGDFRPTYGRFRDHQHQVGEVERMAK